MDDVKQRLQAIVERDAAHECAGIGAHRLCVRAVAVGELPTRFGDFRIVAFWNNRDAKEHVAIVHGDVVGQSDVPIRMHSECLTGDALGSVRCDCRDQLEAALLRISTLERGMVLYLRQEGRGIGLLNKIRAYALSAAGDVRSSRRPDQLEQVLVNLAVNARDAMGDAGRLTLELSSASIDARGQAQCPEARPGLYARLSASDTGKGTDEATQARIFEPFFTTKPPGVGTGLGLSMVHGIISKAGGFVAVRSQPAAGSTFEVWLPLAVGQKPASPPAARAPSGGAETVLVVDDEGIVLRPTGQLLRELGHHVPTAARAEDALAVIQAGAKVDLLLKSCRKIGSSLSRPEA